jgi:biotin-(acetyl-CoA carboxylase) ligase
MRILTDSPGEITTFFDREPAWQKPAALPAENAELWRALEGGDDVWCVEISPCTPRRFFDCIAIVAQAPRSQYDALHQAVGRGLRLGHGVAALALAGTGFHGQHGRGWAVAPGNLFLSVLTWPSAPVKQLVPVLTTLPAIAVADAIRVLGGTPGIKWVNDILVHGKKVSGVLTGTHVQGDVVQAVVHGVGVNVSHAPEIPPTPFVPATGCLSAEGLAAPLGEVFWAVLDAIAERTGQLLAPGGGEALLDAYRRDSAILGHAVRVWEDGVELSEPSAWPVPLASGVVQSIEPDLSLRIEGIDVPIDKGRLALESACQALGSPPCR